MIINIIKLEINRGG